MKKLIVNEKEYSVLKLLGKGKGGYSYLSCVGNKKVVLKKIHHEPCDYYQFNNKMQSELEDYARLKKIGINLPQMLDFDIKNECIVKEFIDGKTVYEMILNDEQIEDCIIQVKDMCKKLYAANLNIDYFPTNFVLENKLLYYIDYECNEYDEKWNFENWAKKYWSKTESFLEYAKIR